MENLPDNTLTGLVQNIADALDNNMVCFMNPDTYEVEDVPYDVLIGLYRDDSCQEALERVDQWKRFITIDRPELSDTVKEMQTFVQDCIPSGKLKEQLYDALAFRRKPDKHFHDIVNRSDYRNQWAVYNRRRMMRHVRKKLRDGLGEKSSLTSIEFV